jgi:hypothetical protein
MDQEITDFRCRGQNMAVHNCEFLRCWGTGGDGGGGSVVGVV